MLLFVLFCSVLFILLCFARPIFHQPVQPASMIMATPKCYMIHLLSSNLIKVLVYYDGALGTSYVKGNKIKIQSQGRGDNILRKKARISEEKLEYSLERKKENVHLSRHSPRSEAVRQKGHRKQRSLGFI